MSMAPVQVKIRAILVSATLKMESGCAARAYSRYLLWHDCQSQQVTVHSTKYANERESMQAQNLTHREVRVYTS